MEILVKFTPEEYERYTKILTTYDEIVKQRDEADYNFKALEDAIQDVGLGITVHITYGSNYKKYSLYEMEPDLKEFWKNHPNKKENKND